MPARQTERDQKPLKRCIYCQKLMIKGEGAYMDFDDIEVCVACYKLFKELKYDRIAAYKEYFQK